jgi:hypothetical protein
MPRKNLLVKLIETIVEHRAEHLRDSSDSALARYGRSWSWWWLPTPDNVLFVVLLLSGLLWGQSVGAFSLNEPLEAGSSTGTIAYQGRLANASGQLLTQSVNMIFRLYSALDSGLPLWEDTVDRG